MSEVAAVLFRPASEQKGVPGSNNGVGESPAATCPMRAAVRGCGGERAAVQLGANAGRRAGGRAGD